MKEASYGATLKAKLVSQGGICVKIADSSTLGLPDSWYANEGMVTFIETKIGEKHEIRPDGFLVRPWLCVNDMGQFEHCKRISKHALVLYAAYYPEIRWSWVLSIKHLEEFRSGCGIIEGPFFVKGHGVEVVQSYIKDYRRNLT